MDQLDTWDPMKEAYDNKNFNCYNQGVGRDLMGSSGLNKGVSLYVQSIPPSLGTAGFHNMFAEYGRVIRNKLINSGDDDSRGSHGYITYENMLDAETAISHLDKKTIGKFTLRVVPALTEEERARRRKLKQHMEDRPRPHMNESSSQFQNSGVRQNGGRLYQESHVGLGRGIGVGRGSIFQGMEREDARHHSFNNMERGAHGHYTSQESLAYQKHVSLGYQNLSTQERHQEFDDMDLASQQRHLLRGYQNTPVQEHYKEVDDHVFVRKPVEATSPMGLKPRGICVYCYKEGCVNKCSNCKVFYCSTVCQKLDWPNHMNKCNSLGYEYYRRDANASRILHGNVGQMQNSNGSYFDDVDDVESNHSQLTTVQMTQRNGRSHGSDNTMLPAKGQEMTQRNGRGPGSDSAMFPAKGQEMTQRNGRGPGSDSAMFPAKGQEMTQRNGRGPGSDSAMFPAKGQEMTQRNGRGPGSDSAMFPAKGQEMTHRNGRGPGSDGTMFPAKGQEMTQRNGRGPGSDSAMFPAKGQEMTHRNGRGPGSNGTMFPAKGQEMTQRNGRGPGSDSAMFPAKGQEMTHRNGRGPASDNAMFPAKGQEMRHFNENHREESSTSAGHVNRFLNTAKVQNETGGMMKGNVNKPESYSGQKTKPAFTDEHGQSKIVNSDNSSMRNIPSNHERGTFKRQDERATTQVSQKFSNSASNRNSRNFETKEASSKTQTVPVSSGSNARVKDTGALMKTKSEESYDKEKSVNPDKQKQNTKSEDGRNADAKTAAVEAKEKLPSAPELTIAPMMPGQCYLTYFESPYKFWISLMELLEDFTELTQRMGKEISESSSTTQVVCKVGGTYGVMYLGEWCRVKVTSITGREITVFFIDYGNEATVKQEDLRLLSVDMLDTPAQAVCCCISKLKPKGSDSWSEKASSTVQKWLGHLMSQVLQFEVVAKKGSVHAVNISLNNKTMSDVLLAGGFAEKVDSEPGLPSLTSNSIASKPMARFIPSQMDVIKIGDQVTGELTNFTSLDRFFVIDLASTKLMNELSSALCSEYKNSNVHYKPVQGELVAAPYSGDQGWYRAEVTNIDDEGCTLYFVDYGNSEVQKVENIRCVTNKIFTETPKQALVCGLFTEQPLSGFNSKIVNEEFKELLCAAVDSQACLSLLVRGKTKEALLVDVIDKSGHSLSAELIRKLSEMSIETQNTNSNRPAVENGIAKDNRLPSSSSKSGPKNIATVSDLGTETLPVESGKTVSVHVSVVKSPMEFYVQLNSKSGSFIAMGKELERSVISSPRLSVPSIGSLAAVQFSQNRTWCRGVVEKIEGKKCLVRFLDYGNSEETSVLTLKVLPASVCHLPAQAIRCCLDGRLQDLSSASILKFKEIVEENSVDIKVCRKDTGVFSVQVFQDGIDIGASLVDSCRQHTPTVEQIPAVKQPKATSDILMETLPANGEPVKAVVTHIDSFSRLFLVCKVVTELMVQLYKCADSLPPLRNPAVGSACAAQYSQDNTWYRARIVGIKSPKTCIVQFLDYGNSEETSMSNLRELDPDLSKLPGQAICCCLFGYEQEIGLATSHRPSSSTAEWINKLRLELLEKPVTVRAVDRKSDTWIVKLENEHGECMNTKYKPACPEADTPKLADLIFEYPSEAEFEACFLHINSLSDFYCQMCNEDLLKLDSLSELLREDMSKLDGDIHLNPVVNGVYASKFMDTWYRCVVEEVRNTKVLIKYIDYGNSEEILASELRPLSPERLQMPVRLLRCKLYGVAPIRENWTSPEMPHYLEMLRQKKVQLTIETRGSDVFHVSVTILQGSERVSVAADLVDTGLARFLPVVSSQKEESRCLLPDPQKCQQSANEQEEDDDNIDEEIELQRKIQELQRKLLLSKQKKK